MTYKWPDEWETELYQGAQWPAWQGNVFMADGTTPETDFEVKAMVRKVSAGSVRKTFVKDAGIAQAPGSFTFSALCDLPGGSYMVDIRLKAAGEVHYIRRTFLTITGNITRDA